jgi:hypothetical protein
MMTVTAKASPELERVFIACLGESRLNKRGRLFVLIHTFN